MVDNFLDQAGGSPRPLYQRVKDYIEERIASGEWSANTRIPSEAELVELLGVSRMTANRALRELTNEGRLVRIQGVGTFVAEPKPQSGFLEIRSIADEIRESGGVHSSEILLLREEVAGPDLAVSMGLAVGAPVYHSILIHRDRGRPIQYADRYVNPSVAPEYLEQDFTVITPNRYLFSVAPVTEVEQSIEAVMPDERIRLALEMDKETPCLLLHRRTWVLTVVATRSRFYYCGSRYRVGGRFRVSLGDRFRIA